MATAARDQKRGEAEAADARAAWKLFLEIFEAERPRIMALYRESGLTPPQLMTLRRVGAEEPMAMSEVARWLACDASNVTGIVDRLEDRRLLRRTDSPGDRRVKMLELTPAGRRLCEKLSARMSQPPQSSEALSETDQKNLRRILQRALDRAG